MPIDPDATSLAGRVAVVTGAAMGIGEAIAIGFARFGADLALCDRDGAGLAATARDVAAAGRRIVTGTFDVRETERVEEFVERVGREFGRIDVLVNNAGGGFQAPFAEVSPRGRDALVKENFTSVTDFVQAALPFMTEHGGSVINITSIEAHRAAPGYAIYAAMKAAVTNRSKSLALELGERNIRVNCIAPDMIPTPGIGDVTVTTPLPRPGRPDDVAGAAIYLASDLSRFVTGTTLHVDGGNSAAAGWRRGDDGRFEP